MLACMRMTKPSMVITYLSWLLKGVKIPYGLSVYTLLHDRALLLLCPACVCEHDPPGVDSHLIGKAAVLLYMNTVYQNTMTLMGTILAVQAHGRNFAVTHCL